MRQLPSWLSATIIALVAIGAVYFLSISTTPSEERGVNKTAPPLTGTLTTGEKFQLSDYRGKVVLINFWGTWCPPCRQEIPDLIKLQEKYQPRGFTIVGLAEKENPRQSDTAFSEDLNSFIAKTAINYPNLAVPEGSKDAYGLQAFPTSYLVDKNGTVVKAWVGAVDMKSVPKLIEGLL